MRTGSWLRHIAAGVVVLVSASVIGCSERDRSDGSLTQGCAPNSASTGQVTKVPHPTKPTECKYSLMLHCNACVYDAQGSISHSFSEPCGVCIGGSF